MVVPRAEVPERLQQYAPMAFASICSPSAKQRPYTPPSLGSGTQVMPGRSPGQP
jgi:hypothetical protein